MTDNDWKKRLGVVYSTNPDFSYASESIDEPETLPPAQQNLRVWLDTKRRGGKQATIIKGFVGSQDDLKALSVMLKTKCGTGGSVKDGDIIIQGNLRLKVMELLEKAGYRVKSAGG